MSDIALGLEALARLLSADLMRVENPDSLVMGVAQLESAGPNHLSLARDLRQVKALRKTRALAVLVSNSRLIEEAPCSVLRVEDLSKALSVAIAHFHPEPELAEGVMPGALVDEGVSMGPGCRVEPGARIEAGVCMGAHCYIGANAVILACCKLGSRVRVGPGSVLGAPGFGLSREGDRPVRIPQVGRVLIEDEVELGARCTVDRATLGATRIGAGSKLDAAVHVGHNVDIGCNVIIAAQTGLSGSVKIGDGAVLGGQVGVADHVVIGAGAQIGAGSGVGSRVSPGARVAGYPALPVERWLAKSFFRSEKHPSAEQDEEPGS